MSMEIKSMQELDQLIAGTVSASIPADSLDGDIISNGAIYRKVEPARLPDFAGIEQKAVNEQLLVTAIEKDIVAEFVSPVLQSVEPTFEAVEEQHDFFPSIGAVVEAPKEIKILKPEEAKRAAMNNILASVKVDLNNISVVKVSNPLGTFQELDTLFLKPSYDIIALQSGYRAAFKALNNDDMIKVRKFTGTVKEQNMKLFTFTFRQMVNSSLGKVSFDTWMKITSEADFETLIYGIYCATFPDETDYTVGCGACGKENKTKISKELLIQAKNMDETGAYIQEILSKNYPPDELVKNSVVNHTKRIMLPESKIILDLVTPTLANYINTISRSETYKNYEPEIFGYLKNVGDIMIPHLHAMSQGRAEFIKLDTMEERIRIIVDMSKADKVYLDKEIRAKLDTYKVDYKLPNMTCAHCQAPIVDINVDLTETLFQSIAGA